MTGEEGPRERLSLAEARVLAARAADDAETERTELVCTEAEQDDARRLTAALTDALGNLTHEFEFDGRDGRCNAYVRWAGSRCGGITRQSPIHRTPARVRAELEERA